MKELYDSVNVQVSVIVIGLRDYAKEEEEEEEAENEEDENAMDGRMDTSMPKWSDLMEIYDSVNF